MTKVRFKPRAGYVPSVYVYTMRTPHGPHFVDMDQRAKSYLSLLRNGHHPIKDAKEVVKLREVLSLKATRRSMLDREVGGELLKMIMQPGDYLIVEDALTIFTKETDLITVMDRFRERQQHLHVLNFYGAAIDCSSPSGQILIGNMRLIHRFNQDYRKRVTNSVRTRARAITRLAGGRVPFFCEVIEVHGKPSLILKSWAIPAAEVIGKYRHSAFKHERMRYPVIAGQLKRAGLGAGWKKDPQSLDELYHFWCAWVAAGRPDVNTLKFPDFILQYRSLMARGLAKEPVLCESDALEGQTTIESSTSMIHQDQLGT